MKLRVPAAILGACMLLSANGCSFLELGLDDALRPPKTMGDEAEIEKLISESAKGSYILKYPKNGNYRSAIITQDLDGDDTAEAIAFFRGKDEATRLHMLVMYETDDGWKVSGDFVTETTDVDCVDFAKISDSGRLDILTGYTTPATATATARRPRSPRDRATPPSTAEALSRATAARSLPCRSTAPTTRQRRLCSNITPTSARFSQNPRSRWTRASSASAT